MLLNECRLETLEYPQLVVVIDTEEEFDWSADFSRNNVAVRSMRQIQRVQAIFDEYRITPVYVVDYPVASQPDGYRPLQEIYDSGRCVIGAHLHPWVNPPFAETVNRHNSFPGNLPYPMEAAKLRLLGERIAERFGGPPTIYKAGRYGIGPHTAEILRELGYLVDLSVCPQMDYSSEGGPNFTSLTAWPYWFGASPHLLELPLAVGYAGILRRWGKELYRCASRPALSMFHPVGILAQLGLVNKIRLSPEGYYCSELVALTRALFRDGLRVFSFTFHSPSVEPGHTPYVQSQRELHTFLSCCRKYFDFFFGELKGRPTTPLELKDRLLAAAATLS